MFDNNPDLIQDPQLAPWVKIAPLVLIHDGGGTIFSYHCLGNIDRPLYGISNPHYHSGATWEGGLPEMARHYAKLIKSVIPRGKLIIGGWSLGGLLSLEVARILVDDPSINLLGIIMIDSVYPRSLPSPVLPITQHVVEWSPYTRQETREKVTHCFAESSKMVRKWSLPNWGDEDSAAEDVHALRTATTSTGNAGPPPVILLRAEEAVPVNGDGVSRVDGYRDDRLLGWGNYRPDLITDVFDIPGHHFNIFVSDEHLGVVTGKIRKACRDLEMMAINDGLI
ncbi:Alpha/Beta hydrolase protein [Lasiosphaeris hirsuta]|uniref:Alpha/Beta hydrolase protein n=1 Tax=Lasiosphaeris hirsuta TaxID=260670 RepID=A0AA40AQV9_9PEZI|nr:Alpha/Beta hydrolase protein [Lasiosphaeris hirsuta]